MKINPWWGLYVGLFLTITGIVSTESVLQNAVPSAWIPYIVAWSGLLSKVGNGVMTFLAAYSSNASGPLAASPTIPEAHAILDEAVKAENVDMER